jgi:PKD repeat protein
MDLLVGDQPCKAGYMFVVNNTTNTVQLADKSFKATKWIWDYKDGKFDTIQNPSHQYAKPGIYEVCLATYDKASNCQSRMCQVIPIGKIDSTKYCKAEYSYFVDNASLQVSFKNESLGKIVKGYWNLGDGFFAYEENPVHKYTKAGLYHVCGSIVDSAGCQSEICKDIQVGALSCNADFNYFVDPSTQEIKFTNTDIGKNLKYFWDFGDGKSSVLANPVNKYVAKGLYKVGHTIIDSVSKCRSDKIIEIPIGEILCNAEFTYLIEPVTRKVKFAITSDSTVRKQWNFGDGAIDTLVRPAHQYLKDGVYQVCLNIYNPKNKCVASRCLGIPVSSQTTVAMLDADFAYMVDPNTLKTLFNDKSTGKVRKYYWDFGDGMSDTTANPAHVYLKAGQYKVCQFVADSARNVSQECKDVFVKNALCKADFNFFVAPGTLSAQLTDISSPGIKEHYWDLGDGKFSNKKDILNTYLAAGTYKICKSILDSANCKASVCKELQVGTLTCKANYSFFVDIITRNVKFTDLSVGAASSYFWDFGDGGFSNLKDPSHIYLKPGIYKVCQTIKNTQNGCSSTLCQDVQVGSIICEADFTYTVDALSRTVTLQNASKGDIKRFYWENGAEKTDTIENTKFTYAADGNYVVCLQVFNPLTNCRANICKSIAIIKDTAKLVRFASDFSYFVVIDSNKVVLTDKSTGDPTQWYWTFGDGTYEKVKNTSHIFKNAGTYKLCHAIFKSSTGEFAENCKEITIGSAPCSLTAGFTRFTDAKTQTVYFSDNSQGTAQKWFWRFGDGTTSQKQSPSHTFVKPGFYLVGLGVRDTIKNCTDYYAEMVQIGTLTCKAMFDYTVDMATNKLTLKNSSSGDVAKYFWEFGDRGTSVETNPVYTYADAGFYRINLIAASVDASCKDVYSQSVQVGNINCSAAFEYYVDSVSNRVFFKNKGLGTATKYMWFFGDGYSSGIQNPDHKYVAPGYYKVGLNTFNPANGCMDYYEEVILVGSEGIDCESDFVYQIDDATKTVKFFDKSNGKGLKYRWNYGDKSSMDTVANTTHVFAKGGYYNVCLTIFAQNGIQNTSCKTVKVAPPLVSDCYVDFVFNVDSTNMKVSFTDKSTAGIDSWDWDFGDNLTDATKNPDHVYIKPGYYKVTLAGKNLTTGCAKAAAKLVNVADVYALRTSFGYGLDSTKLKASGGFPVNFVGLSSGDASKYVWDFGDGTKDSSTIAPTHTYAAAGDYNVCLTASDQVTGQSNSYCYQIKIGPTGIGALVSPDEYVLKAYPSPFNTFVNIEYSIVVPGDYELVLRDVNGRVIDVITKGTRSSGDYQERWEGKSISSGVYYLQLINKGNAVKTITIIKAK